MAGQPEESGELEMTGVKSGPNGGGRVFIIPESVEAWKQRERNRTRRP